jgi:hypothetical protein
MSLPFSPIYIYIPMKLEEFGEMHRALHMKSTVFLNVTACIPVEFHRHFGGTHCLHLQSPGGSQANSRLEACSNQILTQKLIVADVKKFPALHENRFFIIVFIRTRHWALF